MTYPHDPYASGPTPGNSPFADSSYVGPSMYPGPGIHGQQVPPDPILVSIGDIHCTQSHVITPTGTHPLPGTIWSVADFSRTTREIPTWAIVVAIITAILFCGLGLLFLLVKEDRTTGSAQVTVQGPGLLYTTNIPVFTPYTVADVAARVNYARSLAVHTA